MVPWTVIIRGGKPRPTGTQTALNWALGLRFATRETAGFIPAQVRYRDSGPQTFRIHFGGRPGRAETAELELGIYIKQIGADECIGVFRRGGRGHLAQTQPCPSTYRGCRFGAVANPWADGGIIDHTRPSEGRTRPMGRGQVRADRWNAGFSAPVASWFMRSIG